MVKEGYYFGLPPLAFGAAVYVYYSPIIGAVLLFLAVFILYFFRDPDRAIPADAGAIVSPADGRVVEGSPQLRNSQRALSEGVRDHIPQSRGSGRCGQLSPELVHDLDQLLMAAKEPDRIELNRE